jgi:serine/threonine-protein kinase
MPLTIGSQLGSHEIVALLGKGGMGEVYRARDLKLKREVAIKILPGEFSSDADRLSRFQREAEVLASLNHPNIAAIYDVEEANGSRFLVLELVEGETLADRIARGPIPIEEALDIAKHICEALEAAHDKGIIHRDLKPANIKLTVDGKVKVLDFGLAKVSEPDGPNTGLSNSPTIVSASIPGVLIGTAAYMSPEQASGKQVDKRVDIWSFGVVLWEMLTGKSLFDGGETVSHILADVLRAPIGFEQLPVSTPAPVRGLLNRCLDRDVKTRLRDIGEARIVVNDILIRGPRQELPGAAASQTQGFWFWKVAAGFAISAGILAGVVVTLWNVKPSGASRHTIRCNFARRRKVESHQSRPGDFSRWNPDGLCGQLAVVSQING